MTEGSSRRNRWIGTGLLVAAAILAFVMFSMFGGEEDGGRAEIDPARDTPTDQSAADASHSSDRAEREGAVASTEDVPVDGIDPGLDQDMIALRWALVDLDALRAEMPDNLYWKLGAPTSDPEVERERAEERARWNETYGKVLSGTATEGEIHAYYDERARLSADYLEFASRVLEDYGKVLPERDVGLLELSAKMHHARLQSMPRQLTEALERKQRQDRLREAWLADEAAFERAQAEEVERSQR